MKQYLSPEQTAKLIELGFENPKMAAPTLKWVDGEPTFEPQYTIGELIEMLNSVSGLEITRYGSGWDVYDELRAFTGEELIDNLFDMILKLKEEGVI